MRAIIDASPTDGTLALNSDGSFAYTPFADFFGDDTFTYTAFDGDASSTAATVTITVLPLNDPPQPVDDVLLTSEDTEGTVDVLVP